MTNINRNIEDIFEPIRNKLPFKAFSYVRYFPDGKRSFISDTSRLNEHLTWVFQNTPNPYLPECAPHISRVSNVEALVMTTTPSARQFYGDMLNDLFTNFSLDCAFSMLQRKDEYYEEFIFFPAFGDSTSYQTLFAHQDLLHHLAFAFLDKSHEVVSRLPRFSTRAVARPCDSDLTPAARKHLLQRTAARRFYLGGSHNNYLTRKEATCAYFLTRNMSCAQIAQELGISIRTAEDHVERIKLKMNVNNKYELVEQLKRNGFCFASGLSEINRTD